MSDKRLEGCPRDARKDSYAKRFGMSEGARGRLTQECLDILDRCHDDAARRLILGIGEQFDGPEELVFGRVQLPRRSTAGWMAMFSRSPLAQSRPVWVPRKPMVSVPFIDYQHYRGDPRVWQMMELSARLG